MVAWIETRPPAGLGGRESGETAPPGGATTAWWGAFQFAVKEPDVTKEEWLEFQAIAAEGGGVALRADAVVVPASAKCSPAEVHAPGIGGKGPGVEG